MANLQAPLLGNVEVGESLVVEHILGDPRGVLGVVNRVTDHYVYTTLPGSREALRVSKQSGRGTLHQVTFQARRPTREQIEQITRARAAQELRTAIFVANVALTGKTDVAGELAGTPAEWTDLAERLRAVTTKVT